MIQENIFHCYFSEKTEHIWLANLANVFLEGGTTTSTATGGASGAGSTTSGPVLLGRVGVSCRASAKQEDY